MVKPDSTPFRCQGSGPSGAGSRASPPAPEPGPTASDPDARATRTMTASGRQCRTANRRVESPSRLPADPAHLNGPPALGLPASRARPLLRPVPTQPISARRTTAKQARGAHLATPTRRNRCRAYLRRPVPPLSDVPSQPRDTSQMREKTRRVSAVQGRNAAVKDAGTIVPSDARSANRGSTLHVATDTPNGARGKPKSYAARLPWGRLHGSDGLPLTRQLLRTSPSPVLDDQLKIGGFVDIKATGIVHTLIAGESVPWRTSLG